MVELFADAAVAWEVDLWGMLVDVVEEKVNLDDIMGEVKTTFDTVMK